MDEQINMNVSKERPGSWAEPLRPAGEARYAEVILGNTLAPGPIRVAWSPLWQFARAALPRTGMLAMVAMAWWSGYAWAAMAGMACLVDYEYRAMPRERRDEGE